MNKLQKIFVALGFQGIHILAGQYVIILWFQLFLSGKVFTPGPVGYVHSIFLEICPLIIVYLAYGFVVPSLFSEKKIGWAVVVGSMFGLGMLIYETVSYLLDLKMVTIKNYLFIFLPVIFCTTGTWTRLYIERKQTRINRVPFSKETEMNDENTDR